jgi:hypothetical protein
MPGAHRNQAPQVVANGDVYPCRFLSIDPSAPAVGGTYVNPGSDCQVVHTPGPTAMPIAISGPPGKFPATNPFGQLGATLTAGATGRPDVAAQAGEEVEVFGLGDICWLQVAAPVVPGNLLGPTGATAGAGRGVSVSGATAGYYHGAIALEAGGTDQLVRVQIVIGKV